MLNVQCAICIHVATSCHFPKIPHDYAIMSTLCCFIINIVTLSFHSTMHYTTSNTPLNLESVHLSCHCSEHPIRRKKENFRDGFLENIT